MTEAYYSAKVARYGTTPMGVDWSCQLTQHLRFAKLLRIVSSSMPFSLNDIGCGYGALLTFLSEREDLRCIDYRGTDLSAAMIRRARQRWPAAPGRTFSVSAWPASEADYGLASGIFNVQLDQPLDAWESLLRHTLAAIHATSQIGFAVNFVLDPGDGSAGRPNLYRTRPEPWIQHCEQEFGTEVEILSGYGLREFTLLAHRRVSVPGLKDATVRAAVARHGLTTRTRP